MARFSPLTVTPVCFVIPSLQSLAHQPGEGRNSDGEGWQFAGEHG